MKQILLIVVSLIVTSTAFAADTLTVLDPATKPADAYENWLLSEFNKLCDRRSEAFELMIKSESACTAWQQDRKAFFLDRIGGLPERTPLNAQITGELRGKGYRVEKIVLETRPAFHLTGNLYLPDTPAPWPAVLVPCGHSHDGKAAGQYQLICMLLARHGMAALCYDPIGQGERYQMLDLSRERDSFDDAPHVKVPHPYVSLMCTTEHTMTGISSALVGANVAQFRIWDGIRVIDYLQSRNDIIADKIGCTGNSGGGTETAYLMALDDRILAAAPGCYLTTFRKLIETKGPQDGEQNIFGQIAFGMDEADYCIMRAPKPTLICAGTRDVTFDFGGTWELFRDAKRFYSRIGHPDMIDLTAPDAPHGFTLQLREAVTRFMARHLLGQNIVVREVEKLPDAFTDDQLRSLSLPDWTPQQLQCLPQGQVMLLPGERSVFQINAETAQVLRTARKNDLNIEAVRNVIGATESLPEPKVKLIGRIEGDEFRIEKLALSLENAFQVPALLFVPAKPNGKAILYLHGESMQADMAAIEPLVKDGNLVLAAELRGIGETETGARRKAFGAGLFGRDNLEIFTAYLMGKSYVGMRTDDARSWLYFLNTQSSAISLIAIGEAAIPALHAAALEPATFKSITLRRMIPSWESLVGAEGTFDQTVNMVHGVLKYYDLPDLIQHVGQDRITIEQPLNPDGW